MQTVASARSVAVAASYGSGTSMTRDGAPARRPSFAPPRRQPQQRSGFPEQPEAAATARWAAPAKPSDRRRRGGWCTALARPPTPSPGLPDAHHRSPASLELNPYRTRSFLDQPDNVKVGRQGRRRGAGGGWLSQQIWGRLRRCMPAAAGRVLCTGADVAVACAMLAVVCCRRRFGARTWHALGRRRPPALTASADRSPAVLGAAAGLCHAAGNDGGDPGQHCSAPGHHLPADWRGGCCAGGLTDGYFSGCHPCALHCNLLGVSQFSCTREADSKPANAAVCWPCCVMCLQQPPPALHLAAAELRLAPKPLPCR